MYVFVCVYVIIYVCACGEGGAHSEGITLQIILVSCLHIIRTTVCYTLFVSDQPPPANIIKI